jgi:hypothetical protein
MKTDIASLRNVTIDLSAIQHRLKEDLDAQAPTNVIVHTIRTTHQYVAVAEFYEVYNIDVHFNFNFNC